MSKPKLTLTDALRIFFTASCAAFGLAESLNKITNPNSPQFFEPMYALHKLAKSELEKENPDMAFIDSILAKCQELVEQNKKQDEQS